MLNTSGWQILKVRNSTAEEQPYQKVGPVLSRSCLKLRKPIRRKYFLCRGDWVLQVELLHVRSVSLHLSVGSVCRWTSVCVMYVCISTQTGLLYLTIHEEVTVSLCMYIVFIKHNLYLYLPFLLATKLKRWWWTRHAVYRGQKESYSKNVTHLNKLLVKISCALKSKNMKILWNSRKYVVIRIHNSRQFAQKHNAKFNDTKL